MRRGSVSPRGRARRRDRQRGAPSAGPFGERAEGAGTPGLTGGASRAPAVAAARELAAKQRTPGVAPDAERVRRVPARQAAARSRSPEHSSRSPRSRSPDHSSRSPRLRSRSRSSLRSSRSPRERTLARECVRDGIASAARPARVPSESERRARGHPGAHRWCEPGARRGRGPGARSGAVNARGRARRGAGPKGSRAPGSRALALSRPLIAQSALALSRTLIGPSASRAIIAQRERGDGIASAARPARVPSESERRARGHPGAHRWCGRGPGARSGAVNAPGRARRGAGPKGSRAPGSRALAFSRTLIGPSASRAIIAQRERGVIASAARPARVPSESERRARGHPGAHRWCEQRARRGRGPGARSGAVNARGRARRGAGPKGSRAPGSRALALSRPLIAQSTLALALSRPLIAQSASRAIIAQRERGGIASAARPARVPSESERRARGHPGAHRWCEQGARRGRGPGARSGAVNARGRARCGAGPKGSRAPGSRALALFRTIVPRSVSAQPSAPVSGATPPSP